VRIREVHVRERVADALIRFLPYPIDAHRRDAAARHDREVQRERAEVRRFAREAEAELVETAAQCRAQRDRRRGRLEIVDLVGERRVERDRRRMDRRSGGRHRGGEEQTSDRESRLHRIVDSAPKSAVARRSRRLRIRHIENRCAGHATSHLTR
jgi:hypothetical protein